jgi:hypothetical protein
MSLTDEQKAAGRTFLAMSRARLNALPGDIVPCTPYIANYHHACPANKDANTGIALHEFYELSPPYRIMPGPEGTLAAQEIPPGSAAVTALAVIVKGFFGFFWKEGECDCGLHVRSEGRLVIREERPPREETRVARQATARAGHL